MVYKQSVISIFGFVVVMSPLTSLEASSLALVTTHGAAIGVSFAAGYSIGGAHAAAQAARQPVNVALAHSQARDKQVIYAAAHYALSNSTGQKQAKADGAASVYGNSLLNGVAASPVSAVGTQARQGARETLMKTGPLSAGSLGHRRSASASDAGYQAVLQDLATQAGDVSVISMAELAARSQHAAVADDGAGAGGFDMATTSGGGGGSAALPMQDSVYVPLTPSQYFAITEPVVAKIFQNSDVRGFIGALDETKIEAFQKYLLAFHSR